MDLRGRLIRLAYTRPELRPSLLPLLKEAAVGLPPHVLTQLLQEKAEDFGVDEVSTSMPVIQAGMRWTAAVARAFGVWQQRHPDLDMAVLMEDAPEVALALLQGDRRTFDTWGSSILHSNSRPLAAYLERALKRDFSIFLSAVEEAVLDQ